MNTTPNLGLKQPEGTDFYNVEDFNDNMDIVDEHLGDAELDIDAIQALIGNGDISGIADGTLKSAVISFNNLFKAIVSGDASAHNAIYRGKNLTDVYTLQQLSDKVRAGDFSDLYIGDYITKQVTIAGTQYNVDWVFADFNYFKRMGDTECTQNHIVLMPRANIYSAKMNDSNSTAGGYKSSKMWLTEMANVATGIKNAFGASHVLKHREILTNAMNASTASMAGAGFTGASSGWEWTDVEANICNEPMVYGTKVFSSSFYDIGDRKSQLNIFRHNHSFATVRSGLWLSAVTSGTTFAYVYTGGHAGNLSASNSFGVRPYFLFY